MIYNFMTDANGKGVMALDTRDGVENGNRMIEA